MKTSTSRKIVTTQDEDLLSEYAFDYRKARPNRFAAAAQEGPVVVMLDEDIASVFPTAESVKAVLRALIDTMPSRRKRKTGAR